MLYIALVLTSPFAHFADVTITLNQQIQQYMYVKPLMRNSAIRVYRVRGRLEDDRSEI